MGATPNYSKYYVIFALKSRELSVALYNYLTALTILIKTVDPESEAWDKLQEVQVLADAALRDFQSIVGKIGDISDIMREDLK